MKELTLEATAENTDRVIEFVDDILSGYDCGIKEQTAIEVAIDELFSNIAYYAYKDESGEATVRVDVSGDPAAIEITFEDSGIQYDPLAKTDPDTTLSIEDRQIGGMGIFIVKKSMDEVSYEYKDGKNILKIRKVLNEKTS